MDSGHSREQKNGNATRRRGASLAHFGDHFMRSVTKLGGHRSALFPTKVEQSGRSKPAIICQSINVVKARTPSMNINARSKKTKAQKSRARVHNDSERRSRPTDPLTSENGERANEPHLFV
ncbi:unnamed protein product [Bursaphelenchus okinawaensis]|uniref:Uncharacterized protein n=1 Tax=Bursaphelenchus okinawaensis TaxID=465554 RepID=A0A811K6I2_9BILA|nr:unnamed protein product [Bursaphelenchus okinawaensis]CAG9093978.1 unnamed protein product [Bursaphelenchus okinawaensis]